jgi:hypothetical protein
MGNYCGIDLGSKRTTVCVMDKQRKVLRLIEVKTTKEGLKEALSGYRKLTCIVEAAPLAEWTATAVEALGHKITVVCPPKASSLFVPPTANAGPTQGGAKCEISPGCYCSELQKPEYCTNV